MPQQREEKNTKSKTTSAIWAMATGMLGICIPLVAITNSGLFLPLAVIIGAAVATIGIWYAPDPTERQAIERSATMIQALETRIENLETICSSAEFELQQQFRNDVATKPLQDSGK